MRIQLPDGVGVGEKLMERQGVVIARGGEA